MSDEVNIVVTCTKQKTREPSEPFQLRNLHSNSVGDRARKWANKLSKTKLDLVSARVLYAGDHWAVARELAKFGTPKRQVNVWVISAGYGLISIDESLLPYSATFSSPHPDSVIIDDDEPSKSQQKADWWNSLTNCDWPRESPFSLQSLAKEMPTSPLVIVASKNYLTAVHDDLLAAQNELQNNDLLSIISAGTDKLGELSQNLVPADARLQHYVGGVRRSLNIRLARYALANTKKGKLSFSRLSKIFGELLAEAPALQKFDRTPMTDSALKRFIKQQIKKRASVGHTPLLRELRASGSACEQKRFRQLYLEVKETLNG